MRDGGIKPPYALFGNNHRFKSVVFSNGINIQKGFLVALTGIPIPLHLGMGEICPAAADQKPTATLSHQFLKYATAGFFATELVGAYLLLRELKIPSVYFGLVYTGLVLPSGIIAGLFIYKSIAGIKKERLGLSRWALYLSLTILPFHALAWFYGRSSYPFIAPILEAVQLVALAVAAGTSLRRPRFFLMPLIYSLASFLIQVAVLLLIRYL
jgi:hypothetical protein